MNIPMKDYANALVDDGKGQSPAPSVASATSGSGSAPPVGATKPPPEESVSIPKTATGGDAPTEEAGGSKKLSAPDATEAAANDPPGASSAAAAIPEATKAPPAASHQTLAAAAALPTSRPTPSNLQTSSYWDGEFALSVLQASARDESTGRRVSTLGNHAAAASAAAAVGAFAVKDDPDDEEERKKKEKMAEKSNGTPAHHTRNSSFEDRLRRKMAEGRSSDSEKSEASSSSNANNAHNGSGRHWRRRSSRMSSVSIASSIGSIYESIDEGKECEFDVIENFQKIEEMKKEEAEAEAAGSKPPPESNGSNRPGELPKRKNSEGSLHRRASRESMSAEEYQEFIARKIASRADVGMTYSQRKMQEEQQRDREAGASYSTESPGGEPRGEEEAGASRRERSRSRGSVGSFHSQSSLSAEEHEEFIARKISSRMDVGMTYRERQSQEAREGKSDEREEGGEIPPAEVHTVDQYARPAPRVKDEEEEKVELSSEDSIVGAAAEETAEAQVTQSTEPMDAQCTLTAECTVSTRSLDEELKAQRAAWRRISTQDHDSPFSSMISRKADSERSVKIAQHNNSNDPEDLVDISDHAPGNITDPAALEAPSRRRSSRRGSDGSLSGSFIDRVLRGGGQPRSHSLYDSRTSEPSAADTEGRRGTYALGDSPEEHSVALRELADMVEAQDIVQAHLVTDEKPIETVEAIPMDDDEDPAQRKRRRTRKQIVLVWCPLVLLAAIIVAAVVAIELRGKSSADNGDEISEAPPQEIIYDPTLVQVKNEGVLRCGVPDKYGFSSFASDLCRAVAAAVLGPEYRVDLIAVTSVNRFTALAGREIDLLLWGDTHTMERDFHEKASGVGFQFTDPYFYDGLGFAGHADDVACADNLNWVGDCSGLKICVKSGTTHVDVLESIIPKQHLVIRDYDEWLQGFVTGDCGVIAGEQNDISEIVVRKAGYEGEGFVYGERVLSKEPLAMVTRKNDQSWTDVANWVLRVLIHAEMTGVLQANAEDFEHGHHTSHSDVSASASLGISFVSALSAVGNYGEIYSRNMEEVVPRKGLNRLYVASEDNDAGLLYSHPMGVIDTPRHEFAPECRINTIVERGRLLCGVMGDEAQSMDTDFCRALSASLFASDSSLVEFVKLPKEDNLLEILESGAVDVIAGATVDFLSDVVASNETASGLSGLAFSQPYFYAGDHANLFHQGASKPKAMATDQTDADWSTYVWWVVGNSFWAEENGIASANADFRSVAEVKLFGEDKFEWMLLGAIIGTGNYGEIYERNAESLPPRANQNLLNDGSSPQLWHPQFHADEM